MKHHVVPAASTSMDRAFGEAEFVAIKRRYRPENNALDLMKISKTHI